VYLGTSNDKVGEAACEVERSRRAGREKGEGDEGRRREKWMRGEVEERGEGRGERRGW
jgi:hypothetical protein